MRGVFALVLVGLLWGCGGRDPAAEYAPIGTPVQSDTWTCWEVRWVCRLAEPSPYFEVLRAEAVWNVTDGQHELVIAWTYSEDATWGRGPGRRWMLTEEVEPGVFTAPHTTAAAVTLRVFNRGLNERVAELDGPGRQAEWDTLPALDEAVPMRCIAPGWRYNCGAAAPTPVAAP